MNSLSLGEKKMTDYFKLTLEDSYGVIQEWYIESYKDLNAKSLGTEVIDAVYDVEHSDAWANEDSLEDIEDEENRAIDRQEHSYNRRQRL